jgi:hypothetical protein
MFKLLYLEIISWLEDELLKKVIRNRRQINFTIFHKTHTTFNSVSIILNYHAQSIRT